MKKITAVILMLSLLLMCAATCEEATEHAKYTIYNTTGANLEELYLYEVGSEDKGENLAAEGLADGESIEIEYDATKEEAESAVFVLEFKAEGQETMKFETLHFEIAPICLLANADVVTGATAIAFAEPS